MKVSLKNDGLKGCTIKGKTEVVINCNFMVGILYSHDVTLYGQYSGEENDPKIAETVEESFPQAF